jgi:hypothetical protein
MKKLSVLIVLVLSMITLTVKAQNAIDYFTGKWEVAVEGIPQGDAKMNLTLERKDGKLGGVMAGTSSDNEITITDIEEKEKNITVYFTTDEGYDVYLFLEKVDEDNVAGMVMDMFDVKGKRLK